MTRDKALDITIRRALKTAKKFEQGKVDSIYVLSIKRMNRDVISACGSKGRSKKKLKK